MIARKHSSKIILAVMAVAVMLCFLAIAFSGELTELLGGTSVRMEYESTLFDTDEAISIDIQMDANEWSDMLSNATSEEYYVCDVVINGKDIKNVAIRPKGNTSLSAIAMDPDSDRYSFKLEFDHYVKGQTCDGLDKLILNNNYADATNMKEALIYDMYHYIGADASLYNYAKISVNGEYWGVYLALEGVEESFMLRNFGTQDGELYKPDSMEMGGGDDSSSGLSMSDREDVDLSDLDLSDVEGMTPPSDTGGSPLGNNSPDADATSDDAAQGDANSSGSGDMPDRGDLSPSDTGGFSMGGSGANLNYTDDELDSYSTIWEGEITGTGKADHRRVVTALRNISEGTDLETYLDVDNVLKYMAVHTFAVNMDSLSGSMAHNYYLYEYDGQLNIFPWDYNLSFGGMSMGSSGDATDVVNDAIDTPFSGTEFFDALLSNEEYLDRYHAYLQQLVDEYVNGGRFDEVYSRSRDQIDSLVETDPTAFYTYEEYQNAAQILYETVQLRAQSIEGQLNGTIPSTDAGQRQDASSLIDASHIDIEAMGQFDMGGAMGGAFGGWSDASDSESASEGKPPGASTEESESGSDSNRISEKMEPPNLPEGFDIENLPEGFDPNNMPDGGLSLDGANMPDMGGSSPSGSESPSQETQPSSDAQETGNEPGSPSADDDNGRPPFAGTSGQLPNQARLRNLMIYGACLAVMLIALLVVKKFNRRR